MKKILCTILVIAATAPVVLAQQTVIFSKEGNKSNTKKKSKRSGEENIVKISPLSFIGGVIPVYYERNINDFFAVQAGIGVTSKNYLKSALQESEFYQPDVKETFWNDGTVNSYDNQSSLTDYNNRKAKIGYFATIEPRIYFENEGLEGGFIGISYSNAKFSTNAQRINTGIPALSGSPVYSGATFAEYEKTSDIMVTFGSQTLYDHISLEYNTGLGLRSLKGQRYVYGINYANNTFVDGYANIEKTKLNFMLSIKVGYHF